MVKVNAKCTGNDTIQAESVAGKISITQYIYKLSVLNGTTTTVSNSLNNKQEYNNVDEKETLDTFRGQLNDLLKTVGKANEWDVGLFRTDVTDKEFFGNKNNLPGGDAKLMTARWGNNWLQYVDAPGYPAGFAKIKGNKTYDQTMAIMVIAKGTDGNQDIGRFTIKYQSVVDVAMGKWVTVGDPAIAGSNVTLIGKAVN